jgi:hypothetical protein
VTRDKKIDVTRTVVSRDALLIFIFIRIFRVSGRP